MAASDGFDISAYAKSADHGRTADAALLPTLTTEYKAAGNPDNGEISRLVLILGKEGFKPGGTAYVALQYVHLGQGEFGFTPQGQVFSFLFADLQPKLVTVHGRNLQRLFDYIGLRRMPWIRQADRDFQAAGDTGSEPIITRIELEDWRRKEAPPVELGRVLELHER